MLLCSNMGLQAFVTMTIEINSLKQSPEAQDLVSNLLKCGSIDQISDLDCFSRICKPYSPPPPTRGNRQKRRVLHFTHE